MKDTCLLVTVITLWAASLAADYYYTTSLVTGWRVVFLLGLVGVSLSLLAFTKNGAKAKVFVAQSYGELRKVVWPTRQETMQATFAVVAMVVVMGILLWAFDIACMRVIAWLTGYGA